MYICHLCICLSICPFVYLYAYTCKIMRTTAELGMTRDTALSIQSTRPLIITRILTDTIVAYLTIRAIRVLRAGARYLRLDTGKLIADQITATVAVNPTLDLLTANFLVVGIAIKAVGTCTNGAVRFCGADSIASADYWTSANVFAFKEAVFTADASVSFAAINIVRAARFLKAKFKLILFISPLRDISE